MMTWKSSMKPGDLVRSTSCERLWSADNQPRVVGTAKIGDIYVVVSMIGAWESHAAVLDPRLGTVSIYAGNLEVINATR